jgi:hypothetical protein
MIPSIHLLGLLDTLKYLALGGRIGKVQALLGSVLSIKPMLTMKNGELVPAGRVRSRTKGIDILFDFVKNAVDIQDMAIVYNTTLDEAQDLAERMSSIFPKERIFGLPVDEKNGEEKIKHYMKHCAFIGLAVRNLEYPETIYTSDITAFTQANIYVYRGNPFSF